METVKPSRIVYNCKLCGKGYNHRSSLSRHKKRCMKKKSDGAPSRRRGKRKVLEKKYKCENCYKTFIYEYNYLKHMEVTICSRLSQYYTRENGMYICNNCGTEHVKKDAAWNHVKFCNPQWVAKRYKIYCDVEGCNFKCCRLVKLTRHKNMFHSANISYKIKTFKSMKGFLKWKGKEERKNFVFFRKSSNCKISNNKKFYYYNCHFRKDNCKTLRKTCRRSSTAIVDRRCPARMRVVEAEGTVTATYFSNHSHPLTFENVKCQFWAPETRRIIRKMLSLGLSSKEIKENLKTFDSGLDKSIPLKEHFITIKQISSFKNKKFKDDDDLGKHEMDAAQGEDSDSSVECPESYPAQIPSWDHDYSKSVIPAPQPISETNVPKVDEPETFVFDLSCQEWETAQEVTVCTTEPSEENETTLIDKTREGVENITSDPVTSNELRSCEQLQEEPCLSVNRSEGFCRSPPSQDIVDVVGALCLLGDPTNGSVPSSILEETVSKHLRRRGGWRRGDEATSRGPTLNNEEVKFDYVENIKKNVSRDSLKAPEPSQELVEVVDALCHLGDPCQKTCVSNPTQNISKCDLHSSSSLSVPPSTPACRDNSANDKATEPCLPTEESSINISNDSENMTKIGTETTVKIDDAELSRHQEYRHHDYVPSASNIYNDNAHAVQAHSATSSVREEITPDPVEPSHKEDSVKPAPAESRVDQQPAVAQEAELNIDNKSSSNKFSTSEQQQLCVDVVNETSIVDENHVSKSSPSIANDALDIVIHPVSSTSLKEQTDPDPLDDRSINDESTSEHIMTSIQNPIVSQGVKRKFDREQKDADLILGNNISETQEKSLVEFEVEMSHLEDQNDLLKSSPNISNHGDPQTLSGVPTTSTDAVLTDQSRRDEPTSGCLGRTPNCIPQGVKLQIINSTNKVGMDFTQNLKHNDVYATTSNQSRVASSNGSEATSLSSKGRIPQGVKLKIINSTKKAEMDRPLNSRSDVTTIARNSTASFGKQDAYPFRRVECSNREDNSVRPLKSTLNNERRIPQGVKWKIIKCRNEKIVIDNNSRHVETNNYVALSKTEETPPKDPVPQGDKKSSLAEAKFHLKKSVEDLSGSMEVDGAHEVNRLPYNTVDLLVTMARDVFSVNRGQHGELSTVVNMNKVPVTYEYENPETVFTLTPVKCDNRRAAHPLFQDQVLYTADSNAMFGSSCSDRPKNICGNMKTYSNKKKVRGEIKSLL